MQEQKQNKQKKYDCCSCGGVDCKYFPQEPSEIIDSYFDEDGVKHRKVTRFCMYTDRKIISFSGCEFYCKSEH